MGRIAALVALIIAAVALILIFSGNGEEYTVTGEFENASQLVVGNEVVIAGQPVGLVKSIELDDDGDALVTFSVEEEYAPLDRKSVV